MRGELAREPNAAIRIAADIAGMSKARGSDDPVGAAELGADERRLGRFNAEQREQLAKRLAAAEERLPQQVTMAYRHLLLLGESDTGGAKLDHIDLGRPGPPPRSPDAFWSTCAQPTGSSKPLWPRLLSSPPVSACSPRAPTPPNSKRCLGFFYRLPRLPKLANAGVLRRALAEGVEKGLFGLASGSAWDAEDAVLRFAQTVEPTEIQFQPGICLVRAATIKEMLAKRTPPQPPTTPGPEPKKPTGEIPGTLQRPVDTGTTETAKPANTSGPLPGVTIHIKDVPASKMRDVLKVAVLPLSAASADVSVELTIRADGGLAGIPRETLNLVTLEGLRQLGIHDVDVTIDEKG